MTHSHNSTWFRMTSLRYIRSLLNASTIVYQFLFHNDSLDEAVRVIIWDFNWWLRVIQWSLLQSLPLYPSLDFFPYRYDIHVQISRQWLRMTSNDQCPNLQPSLPQTGWREWVDVPGPRSLLEGWYTRRWVYQRGWGIPEGEYQRVYWGQVYYQCGYTWGGWVYNVYPLVYHPPVLTSSDDHQSGRFRNAFLFKNTLERKGRKKSKVFRFSCSRSILPGSVSTFLVS